MSEREQKNGENAEVYSWDRFRRVCALSARGKARRVANDVDEAEWGVSDSDSLLADLQIQRDIRHRLALEFAQALSELELTQRRIDGQQDRQLDGVLEAQVLELAVCEEAFEVVSEEVDFLTEELRLVHPE